MEKTKIKSEGYMIGCLDGYLLTKDMVEKVLGKAKLNKNLREQLTNEFDYIQARILGDRLFDIKQQFEIL